MPLSFDLSILRFCDRFRFLCITFNFFKNELALIKKVIVKGDCRTNSLSLSLSRKILSLRNRRFNRHLKNFLSWKLISHLTSTPRLRLVMDYQARDHRRRELLQATRTQYPWWWYSSSRFQDAQEPESRDRINLTAESDLNWEGIEVKPSS